MKQTNKKRRLFEDDEIFGTTDALPLSKVPADAAKAAVGSGKKDNNDADDIVKFKEDSWPASKLQPSQKEVIPKKAVEFAFSALMKAKPMESGYQPGDLDAIISSDLHIMDGHHRWAAVNLLDPSANIKGTQIMLPGKALVTALNIVTAGQGRSGNTGEGNIANFGGKPVEDAIRTVLENGYWAVSDPEKCKAAFKEWAGGDIEAGIKKMLANAEQMPKAIPSWAPARVDMPVINAPEVANVAAQLAAGEIDIKSPYSSDVKSTGKIPESVMINMMESYFKVRMGLKPMSAKSTSLLKEYNRKNKKRLQESYAKKIKKQKLQERLVSILKPLVKETIKSMIKK